jgi:hypothetical protein
VGRYEEQLGTYPRMRIEQSSLKFSV